MLPHVLAGCKGGYADEATPITKRFYKTNMLTVNCSRNHFRCRIILRLCKRHVFASGKVWISSSDNSYVKTVQVPTVVSMGYCAVQSRVLSTILHDAASLKTHLQLVRTVTFKIMQLFENAWEYCLYITPCRYLQVSVAYTQCEFNG
jgi:hypothetical protein